VLASHQPGQHQPPTTAHAVSKSWPSARHDHVLAQSGQPRIAAQPGLWLLAPHATPAPAPYWVRSRSGEPYSRWPAIPARAGAAGAGPRRPRRTM